MDASYTLQPSLASDALIRIASKVSEPCPALAKGLLRHAFDLGGSIDPETAFKIGSGMGVSTDSHLFQAHSAYLLQEDSLSLRSRVVLVAVALDSRLAIDLFQRIAPPRPAASGCSSALVPEVAIYYESAEKVLPLLKKPTTNQPTAHPELQELVSATTSAAQLIPLAHLLVNASANLSPSEFASLLNAMAAAIDNLPLDDNAFHSRGQYPAIKAYDQLIPIAHAKQVSSSALAQAVHNYLERSLNGPHCDGNVPKDLMELVILFKSLDRSTATSDSVQPLPVPTVAPLIEPAPDPGEYWNGPKTKQLLLDAKHLNFDDNWNQYTEADRKTPEWRDRVERLLNHIDDWHESDEADPADYLHERCILLHGSLAYLPVGSLYNRIVSLCLDTLAESTLQWDNPEEWDLEVHHFLDFAREDRKRPAPTAAIAALKNSSNTYLHAKGVIAEFLEQKEVTQTTKGGRMAAQ